MRAAIIEPLEARSLLSVAPATNLPQFDAPAVAAGLFAPTLPTPVAAAVAAPFPDMTGRWTGTLFVMYSPSQLSIQFVVTSQFGGKFQATISDPNGRPGEIAGAGKVTRTGKMRFTVKWRDSATQLPSSIKLAGTFAAGDGTSTVDMIDNASFVAKRGRAKLAGWFFLRRDPPPPPIGAAG